MVCSRFCGILLILSVTLQLCGCVILGVSIYVRVSKDAQQVSLNPSYRGLLHSRFIVCSYPRDSVEKVNK